MTEKDLERFEDHKSRSQSYLPFSLLGLRITCLMSPDSLVSELLASLLGLRVNCLIKSLVSEILASRGPWSQDICLVRSMV